MVMIKNPQSEYIRQLIWTAECGEEEETPHIQAYIKLMKQQRMSFVKKLYPRGHFRSITSDEYKKNCSDYAQKDDPTTIGHHVLTYNEQIPDVVAFLRTMVEASLDAELNREIMPDTPKDWLDTYYEEKPILRDIDKQERKAIIKQPMRAKLVVSPTYSRIKKLYLREIVENVVECKYKQDADDNERERTGESELHQTVTIDCASSEEEDGEEDSETDEGSDASSEADSEWES
jgi:hypothetical protein